MRHRVTLQSPPTARDAVGARSGAWTTVAEVWAAAEPVSSREQFAAGQINAEGLVRFRIRYRDDVLASWRVLWRNVPHAIVGEPIDVRGERVALEIVGLAGARDGGAR